MQRFMSRRRAQLVRQVLIWVMQQVQAAMQVQAAIRMMMLLTETSEKYKIIPGKSAQCQMTLCRTGRMYNGGRILSGPYPCVNAYLQPMQDGCFAVFLHMLQICVI